MKLDGSTASPFVQRVLMVARAKGHELVVEPPPGGSMQSPEFAAISPMRRIPVLACGDGWTLAESGAIARYLDETLPGPALLPADPRDRARVRLIETLATGELAGMRPIMVGRVFGMPLAEAVIAAGEAQVAAGLDAIERARDPAHAYAAGAALGHADAILLPVLTLCEIVDSVAGTLAIVAARPGVAAYRARMADDPVAARTIAEMRAGFAAITARRAAETQAA